MSHDLTVAFDASSLLAEQTGIGAAVRHTLAALRHRTDVTVRPFAYGATALGGGRRLPPGARRLPIPTRLLLGSWSRSEALRLDRLLPEARVLHAAAFIAPPSRLPTLVTVHDCAFALHPETTEGSVRLFERILRRALDRGAWVHCSTEAVAGEVQDVFGLRLREQGRLVVVPFGVPPLGAQGAAPARSEPPYVLALGASGPRKNLVRLVRAFGEVAATRPDVGLVLAGPDGSDRPALDRTIAALPPEVRARVRAIGHVDDATRVSLLGGAAILAYPSLYEGFGFPMLEAMRSGVPVLAARVAAIQEVGGDAAAFVDPIDEAAIAAGLGHLLDDEQARRDLIVRGTARAATFTWERTAKGLAEAYRALAATSS